MKIAAMVSQPLRLKLAMADFKIRLKETSILNNYKLKVKDAELFIVILTTLTIPYHLTVFERDNTFIDSINDIAVMSG